jgi:hypothetical protein
MPGPDPAFGWQEGSAALAIIVIASFLVTWLVTDLLHIRRRVYVPILGLTVLALGAAYLAWSGTPGTELVATR